MRYHSIAISGLPGAGKSSLANKLAATLDWKTKSIGEIWRERHATLNITLPFEVYWKNTSMADNIKINNEFLELVNRGEGIVADTRYAHIYSDKTFKVFMTAPIAVRALRAFGSSKYSRKSCEDIEQLLDIREKDEVIMGRKLWGDDYNYREEKHYNLVLDSSLKSVEDCHKGILIELGQ